MNTYDNLLQILQGGRNATRRNIPSIRSTSVHQRRRDVIALRYHQTDVITARTDGRVILNSGGWRTLTTKARINEYGPAGFTLYQDRGVWFVCKASNLYPDAKTTRWNFADGMMINEKTGRVSGFAEPGADLALRKALKKYVKQYMGAMIAGTLGKAPGAGDCLFCLCAAQGGKVTDPGADHLRSHIEEGYLVPSIGINVLTEGYNGGKPTMATSLSRHAAYALQETLRTGEPMRADPCVSQVRRAFMKYFGSRLGVVA